MKIEPRQSFETLKPWNRSLASETHRNLARLRNIPAVKKKTELLKGSFGSK
jgi:hypothetical protein